ncbi:MAG: acyltransferase family protein [Acidimicrobiia bacterium]
MTRWKRVGETSAEASSSRADTGTTPLPTPVTATTRVPGGPPTTLRHVPALDGLRGLAVAGVLLFHAGHLRGGYLGVDLFFVLSGFLITSLLLTEWNRARSVSLGHFWARRARRLLPALFGMLAGVALYATFFASAEEFDRLRTDALATIGYVANWQAITGGQGYWEIFAAPSPLEHVWSLAIEEQFYLLWPLVFVAVFAWRRGTPRTLFYVSTTLAVVSALWMFNLYTPGGDTNRVYLGTDTRVAAILIGAALASLVMWRGTVRSPAMRVSLEVVAVVAASGLALAWLFVDGQTGGLYTGGLFLCGIAVAAIIAAAVHPTTGPVARALSLRPLCWLGLISYGLYLWHWPVYVVLSAERTGLDGWVLTTVRVGVSLAFAVLSYFLLEMPIRRGALPGWRIGVVAPAAALVLVVALMATTVGGEQQAELAFSEVPAAALPTEQELIQSEPSVHVAGTTADVADTARQRRLLVVGDSVSAFLGSEIDALQGEWDIVARNGGRGACGLNDGERRVRTEQGGYITQAPQQCTEAWDAYVQAFQPDVTLLILGAPSISEWEIDGTWQAPCEADYDRWYHDRLSEEVDRLTSYGGTVVITTAPETLYAWGPTDKAARTACVNEVHHRVASDNPRAAIVDLRARVCPDGECHEYEQGVKLRPDGLHFEDEGARIIARWLVPEALAAAPPDTPEEAATRL